MLKYYYINQKVTIKLSQGFKDYNRPYYSTQTGFIKGVKILPNHIALYLIEFLNHDRIWFIIDKIRVY